MSGQVVVIQKIIIKVVIKIIKSTVVAVGTTVLGILAVPTVATTPQVTVIVSTVFD